jgi:hypothetical protein
MKSRLSAFILVAALLLAGGAMPLQAQASSDSDSGFGPLDPALPAGLTVDQVIEKFAARESVFDEARHNYGFRQNTRVQTLDENGKVDGEYQQTTDISYNNAGQRVESVVFAPANSLTRMIMTAQDFSDIEHRLPFVLTKADLPDYDIHYLGRQKVDDLDTYVFQAGPKQLEKGKRYFQGKVWVDQQDLQIVLVDGRNVPDDIRHGHEDLSPPFSTYYEQVDGDYWFPTYTKGEGMLNFSAGSGTLSESIHIRQIITYTHYTRFGSRSRILYNGQEVKQAPPDTKPPQKP